MQTDFFHFFPFVAGKKYISRYRRKRKRDMVIASSFFFLSRFVSRLHFSPLCKPVNEMVFISSAMAFWLCVWNCTVCVCYLNGTSYNSHLNLALSARQAYVIHWREWEARKQWRDCLRNRLMNVWMCVICIYMCVNLLANKFSHLAMSMLLFVE